MILPGLLSLTQGYVEFRFYTPRAVIWVWFPSVVTLLAGLLMNLIRGLREFRVPFRLMGIIIILIVPGGLRVAYELGVDLTVRTGLFGSLTVPTLIDALADQTASSRVTSRSRAARNAIFFLGDRSLPRLITALKDSDWSVRTAAAGVLAQFGETAAIAETALIINLKDPDPRVRAAAADAVLGVAPTVRFKVPVLIDIMNGGDSLSRIDAANALRDLGPLAADAVPALSAALKDSNWATRLNAANALGSIGPSAATADSALSQALSDTHSSVRSSAAAALDQIRGP